MANAKRGATSEKGKRKKGFIMAKANPIGYLKNVRAELGKITWPSRKETMVSTIMVFVMVVIMAIFLFLTDQVVAFLVRSILGLGN